MLRIDDKNELINWFTTKEGSQEKIDAVKIVVQKTMQLPICKIN